MFEIIVVYNRNTNKMTLNLDNVQDLATDREGPPGGSYIIKQVLAHGEVGSDSTRLNVSDATRHELSAHAYSRIFSSGTRLHTKY